MKVPSYTLDWIMKQTETAYMRHRYGTGAWQLIIRFLHGMDFAPAEIVAILYSKHMRLADDSFGTNRGPNSNTFKKYFETYPQYFTQAEMYYLITGRRLQVAS
jgi:hypothetical protein